ncbi:MAG: radical SAM family heme chaperone HemW [Pseudomonadota bacterium]
MADTEVAEPAARSLAAGEPGAGFGLYVHWPFCQAKCPYCDFNSHVTARIDQGRWAAALAGEVRRVARLTSDRPLTSVFFGGGTPSTMATETVDAVMDAVRSGWEIAPELEVTMEANPTSVEAARFARYRKAGVTRLSLGVQALNDTDLRRLGRLHDMAEAEAAFAVAQDAFERVSFDLICARQDQTLADWDAELGRALGMAVDHISLYQLTIEPGTAFADRHARGGLQGLPDDDLAADLYEATVAKCGAAGLELYEVSNFARPGSECRHNLLYWSGGDYAGIGPGAHGRLTLDGKRVATEQVSQPGQWLAHVERQANEHEILTPLSQKDQYVEYLLMGLRKRDGIDLSTLHRFGTAASAFDGRTAHLEDVGLLERSDRRVRVSPRGRLVLNGVLAELIGD